MDGLAMMDKMIENSEDLAITALSIEADALSGDTLTPAEMAVFASKIRGYAELMATTFRALKRTVTLV